MAERIAIVDGIRTPFIKAGSKFQKITAQELGAKAVLELINRTEIDPKLIDEVIIGNVAQPGEAANISRVIALMAKIPISTPAYTVHRNCASGMQSIISGAMLLSLNRAEVILAGGTESMSNIPLLFRPEMAEFLGRLQKTKSPIQKLAVALSFKLKYLSPVIGVFLGLTDPICGMIMGMTAEELVKEFKISRKEQDEIALISHQRALVAKEKLREEIIPLPIPPKYKEVQEDDNGPRVGQTIEALAKLKPFFDRQNGTVTVGNSSMLTDGAAAVLLMKESKAKAMGYQPLGYIKDYAFAALEPSRMGLGPVYATSKVLKQTGQSLKDMQLIELNEAFAAVVIANERAFASKEFAQKYLDRNEALGQIDRNILNVNGGAIALGHPVGSTGTRLIITILKEMKRRHLQTGLATLCIGGGQGGAVILERE
ncbi:MAG: thiolase family protein [Candidatus Margulisbacteria bacterium]|nr:thiolase family protein [Candidatus Margulisiibacteriota bacterium]